MAWLVSVLCWSSSAFADFGGSMRWVSVGGNLGVSNHSQETYGVLGAEVSGGGLQSFFWGGAYLDAVYDFGTERVRFSLGPEFGFLFLGVDAGLVLDVGEGKARHGFVVRPMLAVRWVFPYVRFGTVKGDDPYNFSEVGVLLKYPLVD
jgi:hypothetical protein